MLKRASLIQRSLTPDLLKKQFRGNNHPLAGHCYVASEVFFHLAGGRKAGYKPMFVRHEGSPHWWVKGPTGKIWDLTAAQFKTPVPYGKSVSKGFLTRQPSKRAAIVMERVKRGEKSSRGDGDCR